MEAFQISQALHLSRLLFLAAVSLSCLAFCCNGVCDVFSCGDYTLDFPFGTYGSGCGDPALQVECDNGAKKPLITIGHYQYYILEPHNFSSISFPTMVILFKEFRQDPCDFSANVYDQFWGAKQFYIVAGYTNMTLGETCTTGDSYNAEPSLTNSTCNGQEYFTGALPDVNSSCESDFTIAVNKTEFDSGKSLPQIIDEGITIEWIASKECPHCETDHRNCTHLTYSSFCYCDTMSYSQCTTASTGKTSNSVS